jgi:Lrp/AsnC family transcriptional regulator, leucine-responsive regulatory protein
MKAKHIQRRFMNTPRIGSTKAANFAMQQKCYATGTVMDTKMRVTGVNLATTLNRDRQVVGLELGTMAEHRPAEGPLYRNDMDKIDHRILTLLEEDARQSFAELGEQVALSKTPCWQRVRELERAGVIRGYRAEIDSRRLGLQVEAFVQVTLSSVQHVEFEAAVLQHPSILQCFTTAGQADYLIHVLVEGIAELDSLLRMEISQLPGVQKIETTVCMKTIKHRAPITGCLR